MKAIAIAIWNRPIMLDRLFTSLLDLHGLEGWQLFLRVDPSEQNEAIAGLIRQRLAGHPVHLIVNQRQLGVFQNPLASMQDAIQAGATKVLYLEDDVEVSADSLQFVDLALEHCASNDAFVAGNLHFSGCSNHAHLDQATANQIGYSGMAISSRFLSSLGLFFTANQFHRFIQPGWQRNPWTLKLRNLMGGKAAGWDYGLSEHLLRSKGYTIQSLLPRVRHLGLDGTHFSMQDHMKGWNTAGLWGAPTPLHGLELVGPTDEKLGQLRAFTTMAQQCWSLQAGWLEREIGLQRIGLTTKNLLGLTKR